jgi:hypothetical protein
MSSKSIRIEILDIKYKKMGEKNLAEHLVHIWDNHNINNEWTGGVDVDNAVQEMRAGDRRLLIHDLATIAYSAATYTTDERHNAVEIIDRLLGNWLPYYMRRIY